MKDDVISNTHANRDKQKMKIKDNVVSNIHEKKETKKKNPGRCNNKASTNHYHIYLKKKKNLITLFVYKFFLKTFC